MDWQLHWNTIPKNCDETDFFKQVGKTVGGQGVGEDQVALAVAQLKQHLALDTNDTVLDLCCGNGLVTCEVAKLCKEIVGVDFSKPLIEVAQRHHARSNASYFQASVLELVPEMFPHAGAFTKIYMHEALQYFNEEDLIQLLTSLRPIAAEHFSVFFGGVPAKEHLWDFYNTDERRADYLRRCEEGSEAIGTWWEREAIESAAAVTGFDCMFIEQPAGLYSAHYRIDILLTQPLHR